MTKLSFEDFCLKQYPGLAEMYKIATTPNESLIGMKVYSNRSGFSCTSDGGTEMIIDRIENGWVHFSPTEESKHLSEKGWMAPLTDLPKDIRLTKKR
jgi:hypothetical protein